MFSASFARWASAVRRPTKRFRGAFCVEVESEAGGTIEGEGGGVSSVDMIVSFLCN